MLYSGLVFELNFMEWNTLLSAKRWGKEAQYTPQPDTYRSDFQRDYDRLIFSSPFRRLQNKTQVFPLPGSIFVHNRLTHSLEVASVGRSLGTLFYLEKRRSNPDIDRQIPLLREAGNIVAGACLAHDLGNPAFGHSGEDAISHFFTHGPGAVYKKDVSGSEWTDLRYFEGNANALRILTHEFAGKGEGSYSLTYATLSSIVKYPCASIAGHNKKWLRQKKYGFFQSEQDTYCKIAKDLGIMSVETDPPVFVRHPLVYLVEAADDICYNIIDLEDAHRLKILSYPEVEELLMGVCGEPQLKKRLSGMEDKDAKVSLLRAKAINRLTGACASVFIDEEDSILRGDFNKSLIQTIPGSLGSAMKAIEEISVDRIYNDPSVVQIEVAGFKVMGGLLEEFIPAVLDARSSFDKKIIQLIPRQFISDKPDTYSKIQTVLDFVSGMTDLYAVELFRKIKGISFSSIH